MKNEKFHMDEIKRNLLDKCFRLGLPVSSNDSIATLQMYLDADSKLEVDKFDFQIEKKVKQKKTIQIHTSQNFYCLVKKLKLTK